MIPITHRSRDSLPAGRSRPPRAVDLGPPRNPVASHKDSPPPATGRQGKSRAEVTHPPRPLMRGGAERDASERPRIPIFPILSICLTEVFVQDGVVPMIFSARVGTTTRSR